MHRTWAETLEVEHYRGNKFQVDKRKKNPHLLTGITVKLLKANSKEKILKAPREKHYDTYKEKNILNG